MARLTAQAKRIQRKARFQRWVKRNIVTEDPRTIEQQMADENSPDRSPVWFAVFVLGVIAFYLTAGWYIFSR
jgi:hypothetical protein